jgi:O-antigen/teichoic acid export membrane protein
MVLGNNNAIILNTQYYRSVLFFGLLLVFMMIGLNMLFIPMFGIVGSALATLISVIVYNTIKLMFIVRKVNLYPFTANTIKSLGIIAVVFVSFYFWDFDFHPMVSIAVKSILITMVYGYLNFRFAVSAEVNELISKAISRIWR